MWGHAASVSNAYPGHEFPRYAESSLSRGLFQDPSLASSSFYARVKLHKRVSMHDCLQAARHPNHAGKWKLFEVARSMKERNGKAPGFKRQGMLGEVWIPVEHQARLAGESSPILRQAMPFHNISLVFGRVPPQVND